jgi:NTP pyrophosphatase (non-canonical NTP hydrolase)
MGGGNTKLSNSIWPDVELWEFDARDEIKAALNILRNIVGFNAREHNFWERNGMEQDPFNDDVIAGKLMLAVSELGEAVEALRMGNPPSEHIPEHDGFSEEIADTIIRLLDICSARDIPIGDVIISKMEYNSTRDLNRHGKTM